MGTMIHKIEIKDLKLTKAFLNHTISENISEIDALLEGWFLWELCKCGFEVHRFEGRDADFGKVIINLVGIAKLKNGSPDSFNKKIESINFKQEEDDIRNKYFNMLLFLGNSFALNQSQKEELIRDFHNN